MDITKLKIESWEVNKLIPYEKNNKKHSDKQIDMLAESIKENGVENPILIEEDGTIISGHGRFLAIKKLGMKFVFVRVARGMDKTQARKLRINVNKTTSTEYDFENLALEIADFKIDEISLDNLGFTEKELKTLTATLTALEIPKVKISIEKETEDAKPLSLSPAKMMDWKEVFGTDMVDASFQRMLFLFCDKLRNEGEKGTDLQVLTEYFRKSLSK